MRTHGWQGEPPSTDDEAVSRIIAATHRCVAERGAQTSIAHVATALGVSRATVYRYFPSTTALLRAAAEDGTRRFLGRLGEELQSFDDITDAIIEGVVQTVAAVPHEPYLQLLLEEPSHTLLRSVTSDAARDIGRRMLLESTSIDWTQVATEPAGLDELVEWALRIVQSFLTNPGDPARTPDELRQHLRRWLGPAVRDWVASSALPLARA
ncbi:TetR family transcriptional regulator [Mycolicibacterium parafortuitum]|uniref:TetR family transcriptional regulator n=1 Tax=Mycolicibacterium parafortuitum TaxID=39692 RepID=A0A7I7UB21_MYCPF|nr:TetR/AcrR family transcriptional regulator [Mycolicibacterium parafortuitum]BBY78628.1 TetR family transcriptional regulator [Mycolicibacterium parafortuitum]